jgi:hypothetical protein
MNHINRLCIPIIALFCLACTSTTPVQETPPPIPTDTPPPPTPTPTADSIPPSQPEDALDSEDLGDGWTLYTHDGDGFSVELPDTWLTLDIADTDLEILTEQMADLNPDFGPMLEATLTSPFLEFSLYAIDGNPDSLIDNPSGVTANIMGNDLLAGSDAATLLTMLVAQLESIEGYEVVEGNIMHSGGCEAVRIVADVQMTDPLGREVNNRVTQVFCPTDETALLLTLSVGNARFGDYEQTFDRIASSFSMSQ